MEKKEVYVVYVWFDSCGPDENHPYILGIYNNKEKAKQAMVNESKKFEDKNNGVEALIEENRTVICNGGELTMVEIAEKEVN